MSPGKIPVRITDRFYGTFFNPVIHNCNPNHDAYSHKQRNSNNLVHIKCSKLTSSFTARSLPNVLVINSRSIRGKIEELVYYVNEFTIQIIIVTEAWLSADIPDDVINIPGFILIRKDRHNGFGGGCAIYVSEEIPMKIRQWLTLRPKWFPRSVSRLAITSVYQTKVIPNKVCIIKPYTINYCTLRVI